MSRASFIVPALLAMGLTSGCETANQAGNTVESVGQAVSGAAGDAAKGAVSLVNVNLSDVLNDLALDLNVDKSNIPINAQIPVTVAANVCGVSINILSVATGGSPSCTAQSTSPELSQAVQQQLAANGSVGGGSQATSGTTPTTNNTGTAGATAAPGTTAAPTTTNTAEPSGATTTAGTQE